MTVDLGLLVELAVLLGGGAVAWGVLTQRLSGHERKLAAHEQEAGDQNKRIMALEQSVADRVARIETKVDLLLAAFVGNLKLDRDE